jgi:hypothetical protein
VVAAFKAQQLLIRFESYRFSSCDDLPDFDFGFDIPPDRIVLFEWADSFDSFNLRLGRMDFKFPVETPAGERTGQFITLHLYGLELETRAVEALRSVASAHAASVSETTASSPERTARPKASGAHRGPKQHDLWDDLLPHLKSQFHSSKIPDFETALAAAFNEAKKWMSKNDKGLTDDALRKGLRRESNRAIWFEA